MALQAQPVPEAEEIEAEPELTLVEEWQAVTSTAHNYINNGDWERALARLQIAYDIAQRFELGDIRQATAASNLAMAAMMNSKFEMAEHMVSQALAHQEAMLGPDHPRYADSLAIAGEIALRRDDYERATEYFKEAFAIRERSYGPGSEKSITSIKSLVHVSYLAKHYEEAARWQQKIIQQSRDLLGMADIQSVRNLQKLARIDQKAGRVDRALARLEEGLLELEGLEAFDEPGFVYLARDWTLFSLRIGRSNQVIERSERWIERSDDPALRVFRAMALLARKDFEQASSLLSDLGDETILVRQDQMILGILRARLNTQTGNHDQAIEQLDAILTRDTSEDLSDQELYWFILAEHEKARAMTAKGSLEDALMGLKNVERVGADLVGEGFIAKNLLELDKAELEKRINSEKED